VWPSHDARDSVDRFDPVLRPVLSFELPLKRGSTGLDVHRLVLELLAEHFRELRQLGQRSFEPIGRRRCSVRSRVLDQHRVQLWI
jgi:hypothetical protein